MIDDQLTGFVHPDFSRPLDLEERLANVPEKAFVRGMLLRSAIKASTEATGVSPTEEKLGKLTSYPLTEILPLIVHCARTAFPGEPDGEALRRIGHQVFPTIRENAAVAFLFSIAGNDSPTAVKLAGRAFSMLSSAAANVRQLHRDVTIVELRGAWIFPSYYSVGVFEGAMRHYGDAGTVKVREHSLDEVDVVLDIRASDAGDDSPR